MVNVAVGDIADVPASGPFAVAYLVFSTLLRMLLGWRAECFRQVRRSARPPVSSVSTVGRRYRPWRWPKTWLARFYGELLGGEVTYADDDWVNLAGPGGKLSFQLAPDYVTPTWPDPKVPQQFHVDVTVDDVDAAEQAVLALGATKTEQQPGVPDGNWRVYLDPAGHPFCLWWD